ncbi:hypothetical protein DY000_02035436 [Brassica cretica]|uniref:Jacalin-type lectin domain-containing protein n=1 Tax=Brassica cretica TaxID=69181 RepID=A0ABQ7DMW8_BRACR|nr:hypothetical protein DY000_02035436 [Brassica cretica]
MMSQNFSKIPSSRSYFAPIQAPTPLIPTKKLPSVGGNGGVKWDDGVFDGVRKISIGQCYDVVSYVKFDYIKGTELVSGGEHGETLPEASELVLEDDEYLLSLGGYIDKSRGASRYIEAVKTNKRDSGESELNYGEKFTLGENGNKIVGFYGQASDVLHSIGVYVVRITSAE